LGEIKSTLDLVLEKTKHLALSSEEKQAQTQKNIDNRIKGIVQKYQDGLFSLGQLQRDYDVLKTEFNLSDNTSLADEIINRLDPGMDNRALFDVLEHCCHLESGGLSNIVSEHQAGYETAAQNRMATLKERLAQQHSISGSAVVPNLDADEKWHREAQELRSLFEEGLSRERLDLLGKAS
jgi:Ni,Fe-hydrogenase I large subunit